MHRDSPHTARETGWKINLRMLVYKLSEIHHVVVYSHPEVISLGVRSHISKCIFA